MGMWRSWNEYLHLKNCVRLEYSYYFCAEFFEVWHSDASKKRARRVGDSFSSMYVYIHVCICTLLSFAYLDFCCYVHVHVGLSIFTAPKTQPAASLGDNQGPYGRKSTWFRFASNTIINIWRDTRANGQYGHQLTTRQSSVHTCMYA